MNNLKIIIDKRVPKEIFEKYEGVREFINSRIEEFCSQAACRGGNLFPMFSC